MSYDIAHDVAHDELSFRRTVWTLVSLHTYTNAEIQFLTTPLSLPDIVGTRLYGHLPCQRPEAVAPARATVLVIVGGGGAGACEGR